MFPTVRIFDRIILPLPIDSYYENHVYDGITITPYRFGLTKNEMVENHGAKILLEKNQLMLQNDPFNNVALVVKNMYSGYETRLTKSLVDKLLSDLGVVVTDDKFESSTNLTSSDDNVNSIASVANFSWADECKDDDDVVSDTFKNEPSFNDDQEHGLDLSLDEIALPKEEVRNTITSIVSYESIPHYLALGTLPSLKYKEFKIKSSYQNKNQTIHFFKAENQKNLISGESKDGEVLGYAYLTEKDLPSNLVYFIGGFSNASSRCGRTEIQVSIVADQSTFRRLYVSGKLFNLNRVDLITNKTSTDKYKFMNYTGELAGINYVGIKRDSKLMKMQSAILTLMRHCKPDEVLKMAMGEFERFMIGSLRSSEDYIYRTGLNATKTVRPLPVSYDPVKEFRRIKLYDEDLDTFKACLDYSQSQFKIRDGRMFGAIAKMDNAHNLESPCGRSYTDFASYILDPCAIRAKAFGIRQQDARDKGARNIDNNFLIKGYNCIDCGRLFDVSADAYSCAYFCLGVQHMIKLNGSTSQCLKSPFGRF